MKTHKYLGKWFLQNFERVVFSVCGFAFLIECYFELQKSVVHIAIAATTFGMAFLCFTLANLSRFKRFKGLGLEAEMWESKQEEAADLIDQMRAVVSIYSRELLLGKVKAGRSGSSANWSDNWKLLDELAEQHAVLGQKIDLTEVKKKMDDYFLYDLTRRPLIKLHDAKNEGVREARDKIKTEFGSPVTDPEAYGARWEQTRKIPTDLKGTFQYSSENNLAELALDEWRQAREILKDDFGIELAMDPKVIERLEAISRLYESRPVKVTEELIGWANGER